MFHSGVDLLMLDEAHQRLMAGDLTAAAATLDAADADTRDTAIWQYARGLVALRAGDVARAIEHFEKAVELEPGLPEPKSNLGAALLERARQGDAAALGRALTVLTQSVAMGPRLPDPYTNLGMAHLINRDPSSALAAFDRALQIEPRHLPALYNRAAALNALGRLDECLQALDAVLTVSPDFPPALESRQNTLRRLGKH